jgi:hypothetical protein
VEVTEVERDEVGEADLRLVMSHSVAVGELVACHLCFQRSKLLEQTPAW